ncbi:pyrroline-5-carboxylate reductase [Microvirga pudoricolor]|uniref:pyrroline-5-carboxylate reductase n=1 Tax=Microvirga pudoricolor TaxID=2778729 RepID=UPI00194DEBD4|nr:pyrroline-5-carboxylate reductase [Microvirga pudoricolor]MBM6592759.1 pyrroline-5-carboxylate reductase [Microvirga pudoricolor]
MPDQAKNLPSSIILVGAGKMGGAMLEGWLGVGVPGSAVTVVDPRASDAMKALCEERGVALNPATVQPAEVVVLGIKPQTLEEAAPVINGYVGRGTLIVSILAGKTIRNLRDRLPNAGAVVRAMPNLPASIGRGATGVAASEDVTEAQKAIADTLLRSNGLVEWLPSETMIDAVTAMSGGGPAYVFLLVEHLAAAGVAAGLPEDLSQRLARATVSGAGELLARSDLPPETLRQNVTSPGGTTAAALKVLMAEPGGVKDLMKEAILAARHRAGELAG